MNRLYWLLVVVCVFMQFSCGSEDEDYAEQKKHERKVVESFLGRKVVMMMGSDTLLDLGKVKVISEDVFIAQDSVTDVSKNEFVLFANSGIYMQIVREGAGSRIEPGENRRLMCRFWEYNIMGDSLQLTNRIPQYAKNPEYLNVSNRYGTFSGSFDTSVQTGSLMYNMYQDARVPDGWLKPLEYIKVGPQTDETRIAKVRMIVPHSAGQSHAMSNVYPCFYELTFQEL